MRSGQRCEGKNLLIPICWMIFLNNMLFVTSPNPWSTTLCCGHHSLNTERRENILSRWTWELTTKHWIAWPRSAPVVQRIDLTISFNFFKCLNRIIFKIYEEYNLENIIQYFVMLNNFQWRLWSHSESVWFLVRFLLKEHVVNQEGTSYQSGLTAYIKIHWKPSNF